MSGDPLQSVAPKGAAEDDQLMLLVAQGGKSGNDALARLLAIHWQRVNAVIRRSIGDRESAEELTADVFSRV